MGGESTGGEDSWVAESVVAALETADPDEAAAVAAAIEGYLAAERRAASADGLRPYWPGGAWGFAGRLADGDEHVVRVPEGAPRDPWAVAARADRF